MGVGDFLVFVSHADLEKEQRIPEEQPYIYIRVLKVLLPKRWLACSVTNSIVIDDHDQLGHLKSSY